MEVSMNEETTTNKKKFYLHQFNSHRFLRRTYDESLNCFMGYVGISNKIVGNSYRYLSVYCYSTTQSNVIFTDTNLYYYRYVAIVLIN